MNIHLIEKQRRFEMIDSKNETYESGFWAIQEETAKKAIKGNIYFHKKKQEPSFFGGEILDYRVQNEGEFSGRIVFTFRAMIDHKNVKTGSTGWGMEKKIE
jgi:hypothetical protein